MPPSTVVPTAMPTSANSTPVSPAADTKPQPPPTGATPPHQPTPTPAVPMFAECVPEDLYQLLLNMGTINDRTDLKTSSYGVPEICESVDIVATAAEDPQIYNDNIFVLPISNDLIATSSLNPFDYTNRFYQYFDDEFDFLIFVTSLYEFEVLRLTILNRGQSPGRDANPTYWRVSNDVHGIGMPIYDSAERRGSAGRLQGVIRLPAYRHMSHYGTVSHELMHHWAAYITGSRGSHWHLSSANGMVGGFDIADLVDLGEGRYTVTAPWRGGGSFGHPERYSPIELYVAGLIPAEEVPDLWVAEDVDWPLDQEGHMALTEGGHVIFTAGKARTYTIEDIIAEHGKRVPDASRSQRDFRAAVILLIDENHPAYPVATGRVKRLHRGVQPSRERRGEKVELLRSDWRKGYDRHGRFVRIPEGGQQARGERRDRTVHGRAGGWCRSLRFRQRRAVSHLRNER